MVSECERVCVHDSGMGEVGDGWLEGGREEERYGGTEGGMEEGGGEWGRRVASDQGTVFWLPIVFLSFDPVSATAG